MQYYPFSFLNDRWVLKNGSTARWQWTSTSLLLYYRMLCICFYNNNIIMTCISDPWPFFCVSITMMHIPFGSLTPVIWLVDAGDSLFAADDMCWLYLICIAGDLGESSKGELIAAAYYSANQIPRQSALQFLGSFPWSQLVPRKNSTSLYFKVHIDNENNTLLLITGSSGMDRPILAWLLLLIDLFWWYNTSIHKLNIS